ncbi:MAG: ATP-binding protein, partial [Nitrospirae bacterium]
MLRISEREVGNRLYLDNPWWHAGGGIDPEYQAFPRRAYLEGFSRLLRAADVHRAVVLLGPRRVGKTVLVYHAIQELLERHQVSGRDILYVSLETPIYTGLTLDGLVDRFLRLFRRPEGVRLYVFFDEIQYLEGWEFHLKSLVDTYREVRFVATGSAAAALKTKSAESGAGRFTDFLLPPLTFAEYLRFIDRESELVREGETAEGRRVYEANDIRELNAELIRYLNFGGFPEAVFSREVRQDPRRYIKSDIIDKVLLRDLPLLYGISDVRELNSLFNTLAYNTAQELSLGALSQTAHVARNTLTRYLAYLEAAFLIGRMRRVDQDARHFRRMTAFKVYLTNPTMRAALFGPVEDDSEAMGPLVETAVFSQGLHDAGYLDSLYYARWKRGEVDFVSLDPATQRPRLVVEVKWSDLPFEDPRGLRGLVQFAARHPLRDVPVVTTRTKEGRRQVGGIEVAFTPAALHCYT